MSWFWWFMLVCDLIIPLTMIVIGRIMWKRPPRDINSFIGYRTARSMKNMDTWKFAHEYAGLLWWRLGWIVLIPSIAVHIPFYRSSDNAIGALGGVLCLIQCAIMIATIVLTERELKRNFTELGNRRN